MSSEGEHQDLIQAVILAAGKGKRFPGEKPKVLQEVAGKPLLKWVLELAEVLGIKRKIVVIGHLGEQVQQRFFSEKDILFVWQGEQLGTGHAVKMALSALEEGKEVLILYGDTPALKKETVQKLMKNHQREKNTLTLLTALLKEPKQYGRILRDATRKILGIREAKDCSAEELHLHEVNCGILVVESKFLKSAVEKLQPKNQQGEYYLTDIVEIAVQEGKPVGALVISDEDEIKGVNSPEELAEMERILIKRRREKLFKVVVS